MMTNYIAYTEDSGSLPLYNSVGMIILLITGILAIRAAWKSRAAHSWLFVHLFMIIFVTAIGGVIHFKMVAELHVVKHVGNENAYQYDLMYLAKQNANLACVVALGAVLGAFAAVISARSRRDAPSAPDNNEIARDKR